MCLSRSQLVSVDFMGFQKVFNGGVSGYLRIIFGVCQGLAAAFMPFQGRFRGCQCRIMGFSGVFQGVSREIQMTSGMFLRCFRGFHEVSRGCSEFSGAFQVVSGDSQVRSVSRGLRGKQ